MGLNPNIEKYKDYPKLYEFLVESVKNKRIMPKEDILPYLIEFIEIHNRPPKQSEEYKNSSMGQCETKIENFFKKIIKLLFFWKR
mgnify:CR=1 FL=1